MNRRLSAIGLTAGLALGGIGGIVLTTPATSGAQTTESSPPAQVAPTAPDGSTRPDPSARLAERLAPLVADGTIDQAQADAVIAALKDAGPGGPGGPGGRHGRGPKLDAAAAAIGIPVEELRTALGDGQTMAQVAEAKGVAAQAVVDALVADARSHAAEEVASGRHTQEEVDERLADIEQRITDMVNNPRPEKPERPAVDPATPAPADS